MSEGLFAIERRAGGVVWITLDRPEIHNAFDDRLIAALTRELAALGADPAVRALVLTGRGKSFSAGADLNWMRRSAAYGEAENLADARALAALLSSLNGLPKPTVARVNGAALGGGVGLIACCDVVVASETAIFGTTEVRLGIIPAVIGPYVVAAIGPRQARRLMLTAERIDAAEARRIGLVHEVVAADGLDAAVGRVLDDLARGGPAAIAAAKQLVQDLAARPITPEVGEETARRIARIRASEEGREGVAAFLEKRTPRWMR
jgi:methylglutaconyl-CoA hydratase